MGTQAIPTEILEGAAHGGTGQPLCPSCKGGYLHPYKVTISLSNDGPPVHGAHYLEGWVAVCVGNESCNRWLDKNDYDEVPPHPPCGFSMPMTPKLSGGRPA